MDVSKLSGLFNNIVPQIVAGNGSKSSNVQRSSNSNKGDAFVGKAVLGQALASVSNGAIPINQSTSSLANAFKTYAENQNQILAA
ncbi:MAG: hypothetical protein RLZZ361_154 [Cyanobacteriota bacterium]|jgi:predicted membrane GTPase involved in stress response